jgi:DNA-binding XRE family transcriptional regulator
MPTTDTDAIMASTTNMLDMSYASMMAGISALKPAEVRADARRRRSTSFAHNTLAPEDIDRFRAARTFLRWSQRTLADCAGLTRRSVQHFEAGEVRPRNSTVRKIQAALEKAGVVFVDEEDGTGLMFYPPGQ